MKDTPLTPDLLLHGYAAGVFPMAEGRDSDEVYWVDPRRRGILPLGTFRLSRSLRRRIRRGGFEIALNRDFAGVVEACADRDETWINDAIRALYLGLHNGGAAHSLEVWQDGELAGGVYGVTLGTAFFGESMFSRRTDASKIALAFLTAHLANAGFTLFDTQFITPHLASLGAVEINRAQYHALLERALQGRADFLAKPPPGVQDVMQRSTQTS